jgi:menaquinone-9 beta-reductase
VIRGDVLIVGGGPAGSTCARVLRSAGWNVIVADRARFPRDKVCAGWLTPGVFDLLDLDPAEYRAEGLTLQEISSFRTGVIGAGLIETKYPRIVSYAVRRCEFDDFLLRRANVCVLQQKPIVSLRRNGGTWIANDEIQAPIVIGAGGHFCPVARHLRGGADTARPVVAKEAEFRLAGGGAGDPSEAPELFFCRDLEGYAWYVRKGDYVNVGIGRRDSRDFGDHVKSFAAFLEATRGLRRSADLQWRGHAYFAAGVGPRPLIGAGMLLIGDAAGLAYPESGEGIHPAIESGRVAAETLIAGNGRYELEDLQPYAEWVERQHPAAPRRQAATVRAASAAIGRALLGSRAFTRHVLLDRWFLRTNRES